MALAWLTAMPAPASAHGGGLNAEGCHNDRKNGGYQCHRDRACRRSPISIVMHRWTIRPTTSVHEKAAVHSAIAPQRAQPAPHPCAAAIRVHGSHLDRDGDGVGCE
jgi:hypothetical protein